MRQLLSAMTIVAGLACGPVRAEQVRTKAISESEATQWTHHLVPLPKRIDWKGQVALPKQQVGVVIIGDDPVDPLIRQAAVELRGSLGHTDAPERQPATSFTIQLAVGGPEAARLRETVNGDQAYRILADAEQKQLTLTAGTPIGLYYAAKTLKQMIAARATDDAVTIPLVDVTDWPDMATRGVWGVDASSKVPWLSDRKYNHMEQIASSRINEDRKPVSTLAAFKQQMVEEGPTYGISPVPAIVHLEQISGHGLFKYYPEVKGKGENIHEGAICYSSPVFIDILAEWMVGYLTMPGVKAIDVWMAENMRRLPGCQCEKCKGQNRDLMELRAILAAWDKASARVPGSGLWVLTSEETDDSNEEILAALPKEIGFWYYHSLLTYNTSEVPMVPGYLGSAAAKRGKIGVCLNLSPHSTNYQPMIGAQFIHYRMSEFVDKKISAFLGYPTPGVAYYPFNTEAAAEWSWNAHGRTPREFALSWAVRAGMDDPERFAEWAMVHGEVAWDVYGSEWPAGEGRKATGNVAIQLREGKLPKLGEVLWGIYPKPWGDIKTAEQLDRDVALADRSVELARKLDDAALLQESLTIQGYIRSLKALYELKQVVTPDGVAEKDLPAARRWFRAYVDALEQARDHLGKWEIAQVGVSKPRHTAKVRELLERMIRDMTKTAEELGLTARPS